MGTVQKISAGKGTKLNFILPERWLHGTHPLTAGFTAWQVPPPFSPYKNHPELYPHRHCYLTDDITLATAVCDGAVVCHSSIQPEARILNTLDSKQAEKLRLKVLQSEIGSVHDATKSPAIWTHACETGAMMKFASSHPHARLARDARNHYQKFKTAILPEREVPSSVLFLQNLTRRWIDEISCAAESLGYDALIGREFDSRRQRAPLVLVALNAGALTSPVWM